MQAGYRAFGAGISASVKAGGFSVKADGQEADKEQLEQTTTILTTCFGPVAQTPEDFFEKLQVYDIMRLSETNNN